MVTMSTRLLECCLKLRPSKQKYFGLEARVTTEQGKRIRPIMAPEVWGGVCAGTFCSAGLLFPCTL